MQTESVPRMVTAAMHIRAAGERQYMIDFTFKKMEKKGERRQ